MKINPRWLSLGLSLGGCVGTAVTSWLSIKAHDKAKTKETKKEKILCYIKPGLSFAATTACIMGSHGVSRKEIAKLTGALTIAAANKDKIEKVVREKFGRKQLQEVKQEAGKEMVQTFDPMKAGVSYEYTGFGNERFYLYDTGRYFCSERKAVWDALTKIENEAKRGIIPQWNDLYHYLNIEQTGHGNHDMLSVDADDKWKLDKPIEFDMGKWQDVSGKEVTIIYLVDWDMFDPAC